VVLQVSHIQLPLLVSATVAFKHTD
jgi:hypothetical protein